MDEENILTGVEFTNRASEGKHDSPPFILIVDGDEATRRFCTALLFHSGYEVDEAANGLEALEALKNASYDLLITGNTLPIMSGLELIKELRGAKMNVPVIMSMDSIPEVALIQASLLKPTATLLKPYTIADLLMAVHLTLLTVLEDQNQNRDQSGCLEMTKTVALHLL